jgi:hypothetical protein
VPVAAMATFSVWFWWLTGRMRIVEPVGARLTSFFIANIPRACARQCTVRRLSKIIVRIVRATASSDSRIYVAER